MALLALVPVVLFAFGRSLLAVVAALNVVLIFGSLYLLTSPTEGGHGHGEEDRHDDGHAEAESGEAEVAERDETTTEATDSTA